MPRPGLVVFLLCALSGLYAATPARAQSATPAYGWYGEMVAFDVPTRILTARAAIEPHVVKYIQSFSEGDDVVLVWAQVNREADAIRYVGLKRSISAENGYLMRARFITADPANKTLTFAFVVPERLSQTFAEAQSGRRLRISVQVSASGTEPVLTSVARDVVAPPRTAPSASKIAAHGRSVEGTWALNTQILDTAISLTCVFTQQGQRLSGTCDGPPLGESVASGTVDGDDVTFRFDAPLGQGQYPLIHVGILDGAGTTIAGSLTVRGKESQFKATKK